MKDSLFKSLMVFATVALLALTAITPAFAVDATLYSSTNDSLSYTADADLATGEIIPLGDGRAGVVKKAIDVSENATGRVWTEGIFTVLKDTGITITEGDYVWWDTADDTATLSSLGDNVYLLGMALADAASGATSCRVLLNAGRLMPRQGVYVFDCESGVDAATHILVPAAFNPTGFLITGVYGLVTEVFGGASQDQGIVTVEDTDGTDIATLTPSDSGADVVNDIISGYSAYAASTGAAAKVVAANKGIRGVITQATSGAGAAGKMKVYVTYVPLN